MIEILLFEADSRELSSQETSRYARRIASRIRSLNSYVASVLKEFEVTGDIPPWLDSDALIEWRAQQINLMSMSPDEFREYGFTDQDLEELNLYY